MATLNPLSPFFFVLRLVSPDKESPLRFIFHPALLTAAGGGDWGVPTPSEDLSADAIGRGKELIYFWTTPPLHASRISSPPRWGVSKACSCSWDATRNTRSDQSRLSSPGWVIPPAEGTGYFWTTPPTPIALGFLPALGCQKLAVGTLVTVIRRSINQGGSSPGFPLPVFPAPPALPKDRETARTAPSVSRRDTRKRHCVFARAQRGCVSVEL